MTAKTIVASTQDAYSYDRYGINAWTSATKYLLSRGLTDRQVEAFLRSKHTRWAMDWAGDRGKGKAVQNYIEKSHWFKSDRLLHEAQELEKQILSA